MKIRSRSQPPIVDGPAFVAILACGFSLVLSPLFIQLMPGDFHALDARPENRIFWPIMTVLTVTLTVMHGHRLRKFTWPPHIILLLAYAALAGVSVLWAFSPERSFVRFIQQAMIISSIVLSSLLSERGTDLMHGLFLLFALSLLLNLAFVMGGSVTIAQYSTGLVNLGYEGYFEGKNYLGECAALGILLALHEMGRTGMRRVVGWMVGLLAVSLVYLSDSKTALGLAIVSPLLARLTLLISRTTRLSPAIILSAIPLLYAFLSNVSHFNLGRLSYMIYGDATLTGRTLIWDFAEFEIQRRPFTGWGYQSFWLVPNSPSVFDAPGWVKMMPNAHNGYYDTLLELGYVGLAVLLAFILATLHGIGRIANRDPARAQLTLSLCLFIIFYNYFESLWMRGFEFPWVIFIIVAADIARYWQFRPASRKATRVRPEMLRHAEQRPGAGR